MKIHTVVPALKCFGLISKDSAWIQSVSVKRHKGDRQEKEKVGPVGLVMCQCARISYEIRATLAVIRPLWSVCQQSASLALCVAEWLARSGKGLRL